MSEHSQNLPRSPFERPIGLRLSHGFKAVFILAVAVVIFESLIPPLSAAGPGHFDKIAHFAAYAVLAVLGGAAFPHIRLLILAVTLCVLGGGIEIAQALMGQGRDGSWADQLANVLGVGLPIILWAAAVKFRKR